MRALLAPWRANGLGRVHRVGHGQCVAGLRRLVLACAVAACALAGVAATPSLAAAEDDVLADAPVVRRNLQMRNGRQEIGLTFGATLADPYVRNILPGIRYDLHLTDWLAIGADALVGVPVTTALSGEIEKKTLKTNDTFEMESTNLQFLADLRASVAPIAGKFLIGRVPVNFDVHVNLGVGAASVAGTASIPAKFSIAPLAGGGLRVFVSQVVAVHADINNYFIDRTLAVDRNNKAPGTSFASNVVGALGVTFFLPTSVRRAD